MSAPAITPGTTRKRWMVRKHWTTRSARPPWSARTTASRGGATSALLRGRGCRRAHAPDLDDGLLRLGAVVVDLVGVVDHVAPGRHRHRRLGVELLARAHPP